MRRAVVAVALGLALGCRGGGPFDVDRSGSLDLRRIAAVGDGYVAGVVDGALFRSGQETSVPALFTGRVLGRPLAQPLVADPGLAVDRGGGGRWTLVRLVPLQLGRTAAGGPPLDPDLARPYDNLGVPGALTSEVLDAESAATSPLGNPFYDLVLRGRGTVAEQIADLDPTLVLVWFGTTDVLRFVVDGGDFQLAPGLPTSPAAFASVYERLLDLLGAGGREVVLFNVPDPTLMPVATAVPPVVVDRTTGEPIVIIVFEEEIDPSTGEPVLVRRESTVPLRGERGPLAPGDRVVLGALPLIDEGIGVPTTFGGTGEPLPDRAVLDEAEILAVRVAVDGYNEAIERLAEERGLTVVDVRGLVEKLADGGLVADGIPLSNEFAVGQAFGLDGAYFSAKGYGVVTNRLVEALNARYGSRLPPIRTADLPGVPLLSR